MINVLSQKIINVYRNFKLLKDSPAWSTLRKTEA